MDLGTFRKMPLSNQLPIFISHNKLKNESPKSSSNPDFLHWTNRQNDISELKSMLKKIETIEQQKENYDFPKYPQHPTIQ